MHWIGNWQTGFSGEKEIEEGRQWHLQFIILFWQYDGWGKKNSLPHKPEPLIWPTGQNKHPLHHFWGSNKHRWFQKYKQGWKRRWRRNKRKHNFVPFPFENYEGIRPICCKAGNRPSNRGWRQKEWLRQLLELVGPIPNDYFRGNIAN